jgi:hypothetical protein
MLGRTVVAVWGALLAAMLNANSASGEAGAALVLEQSGTTVPALAPYSEIVPGTTIKLAQGARLVFLHYQKCTTVTVVGGEVAVGQASYRAANGSTPVVAPTACPAKVTLREQAPGVAGITLRSGPPPSSLSTRPRFVLVGQGAEAITRVRVVREGGIVLEGPLTGREFRWPADAAPLDPRSEYEIILMSPSSDNRQATVKFMPAEASAATGAAPLTLIRVEN